MLFLGIISLLFFAIFCHYQTKAADTLNPCWKLEYPIDEWNFKNPDSVMFDSCLCPPPQYNQYGDHCPFKYAKRYWSFLLPYRALWMPEYPPDTVILKNWQDIDTSYKELRQDFSKMELLFGKFYIQKVFPDYSDSISLSSRYFYILFDDYQKIEDITVAFDTIPNLEKFGYSGRDVHLAGDVINEDIMGTFYEIQYGTNFIKIKILQEIYNKNNYINIYNYLGNRIYTQRISSSNEIDIDISGYNVGIYFLQINNKIYKFIK
jgi:hypothetical protein